MGVGGDGQTGLPVDPGHGPQHPFHAGGEALFVGGALEDPRTHAGPRNTIFDIVEEVLVQDVHPARLERRRPVVEIVGQIVVGVEAGGHHDVEIDLLGHLLDELDVAAEAHHGQVDDGADAGLVQLLEALDGLGHAGDRVPSGGPVRGHLGRADEDVFVHQRGAERAGVHRPAHRVHLTHGSP